MTFNPAFCERVCSYFIDWRKLIFVFCGFLEQPFSIGGVDEFTFIIKEFESIPFFRVMRCREDDTAVGTEMPSGQAI